jgi:hypothetical protein
MNPFLESARLITRRHFLGQCNAGIGAIAIAALFQEQAQAMTARAQDTAIDRINPLAPRPPHFAPRAKRIIYLHMAGSPPQQDLFDHKPKLNDLNGEPCPDSFLENERFAFIKGHPKILGSPYKFEQVGQAGATISELLPHFKTIVDDTLLIHSMHTDEFNHAPAQLYLYTGSPRLGRASMGSWLTYGLGTENQDLPGFVVLVSGNKTPDAGKSVWGSGFLPSVYQGCQCRTTGDPVLYVTDPDGMNRETRRRMLDMLRALNEKQHAEVGDPETITRIAQYELAFRMQVSVPEVMDISREPQSMIDMYGATPGAPEASLANNCLLARRLVERGVRFVQLFDWGWDTHGTGEGDDLIHQLPLKCKQMDQPVAALVKDLKERGLLDDTLVIWSGEFGRTAMNEERDGSKFLGRDHHPHCFTIWMAGGGVKAGHIVGGTDELGYRITDSPIHIHDLQATIFHLLGMNHEHLTYRYQGRDFRLTDVHGKVVHALIS